MKLKHNYILIYYFLLYLSLLAGFFFNEDFAGGFRYDFNIHKNLIKDLFDESLIYGLVNYDKNYVPHSPLFIIYLSISKKIFYSEDLFRLFNLHTFLLIPLFVGLSLKAKFNFERNDIRYLLPSIFLLSPYFRAGSIWTDDNVFALIFFSISIFNFINYENKKSDFKYVIYFIIFFSLACYFRPIYSIFSIYFSIIFFRDFGLNKKLLFYILLNLLLAYPAFYYVFILDVNKWATEYLFRENIITQISLVSSVIFFYLIPFIIIDIKNKFKEILNYKNLIGCIIFSILLFLFFDYKIGYSGGFFFKLSNLILSNNYLFFVISPISLLVIYNLFFKNILNYRNLDFLLVVILFLLEIDGVIYHETYDPLIYILVLLLIKNEFIKKFIINFNLKRFSVIFSFLIFFYFSSVIKTFIF